MAVMICLILVYFAAAILLYIRMRLLCETEHRERQLRVTRHVWLKRRCRYMVITGAVVALPFSVVFGLVYSDGAGLTGISVLGWWCQAALYIMVLIAAFYLLTVSGKMLLAFFANLLYYFGVAYLFGLMRAVSAFAGPLLIIAVEVVLLAILLIVFCRMFLKMDFRND